MADTSNPLIAALRPLTSRVRTDVTAAKEVGEKHSTWRRVPLTDERLAQHLNGGPARGVCPIVAGAWMGGTLDTSATVVAAGALISDAAMKTGVIVKFSQNALIGVAAFILVVWWTYKGAGKAGGQQPTAGIIWERFPKFVLGFLIASAVFSFFLPGGMVDGTKSVLGELRTWWFALAFVCIGLETKFIDLATMDGGRPAAAFLGAQAVNIVWTLLLAYLLFGGVIFPLPDIK